MTAETCLRLAEHHRKMGDEAGAKMYEDRAKAKGYVLEKPKEEKPSKK